MSGGRKVEGGERRAESRGRWAVDDGWRAARGERRAVDGGR